MTRIPKKNISPLADLDSKELYDGFEGKSLSNIWNRKKFENKAIKIQSKIVRKGKSALQITIHRGDCAEKGKEKIKTSERDELLEHKYYGPREGKRYNYSFSFFIPKDFPIVPTRLVIAQWKQQDDEDRAIIDNPVLALRYQEGKLFITLQTTGKKIKLFAVKEDMRGKWIDIKFNLKFTRQKSGFVKTWMNKKQIINYSGVTAYNQKYRYSKPGKFFFKMGLYRDTMSKPMTIYFDEFHKKKL